MTCNTNITSLLYFILFYKTFRIYDILTFDDYIGVITPTLFKFTPTPLLLIFH